MNAVEQRDPLLGQQVSHYLIVEKLGEGGMGAVYRARDLRLDRTVALKFISPAMIASSHALERLHSEARAIAALNHPNIATIYELEEHGELPFLVLEYLPGGTLRDKVAGRKLPLSQIFDYALPLAEGLAHAHRRRIIHRDVKSTNAMIGVEGTIKLTDFGLARVSGDPHLTHAGVAIGTPHYMAPEQLRGLEADTRSDVYSFGVLLFEIATGHLPGQGDSAVGGLRGSRPDLPDAFAAIVERSLRTAPEQRYQSAEALVVELRTLSGRPPKPSEMPTVTVEVGATVSRRRWIAAGLALILIGVAGVVGRLIPWTVLPSTKQLAVLPFTNVGEDQANQAFCDGVVETLTSTLTQLERFHGSLLVVPSSEVRTQQVSSPSAAQKSFGVNLVVTGSVQRQGSDIRLTVNLVDAHSLRQIAARRLDTRVDAISNFQDDVVAQVADLLEVHLEPQIRGALSAGGTRVAAAYDAYVQARGYLSRYDRAGNLERAVSLLDQAVRLDQGYALAHAALAEAYIRHFRATKQPPWLQKAEAAGERAVTLNDRLAAAHLNLGIAYSAGGRFPEAAASLQQALNLDPISAAAYRELARAYQGQGRPSEAEETYRKALRMRPGDWLSHQDLGVFYYTRQRYRDAEPLFRKVIALTPDNHFGYRNLGGVLLSLGRYPEAAQMLERSIAVRPTAAAYSNLGVLFIYQSRYDDAVSALDKAIEVRDVTYHYDYKIWGNLGDACRWSTRFQNRAPDAYGRAVLSAERQLPLSSSDAAFRASFAMLLAKLGDPKRASAEIAAAISLAPLDAGVLYKSAVVHELAGRRQLALQAVNQALTAGYSAEEIHRDPVLTPLFKSQLQ